MLSEAIQLANELIVAGKGGRIASDISAVGMYQLSFDTENEINHQLAG